MAFCANCDVELSEDAAECANCGATFGVFGEACSSSFASCTPSSWSLSSPLRLTICSNSRVVVRCFSRTDPRVWIARAAVQSARNLCAAADVIPASQLRSRRSYPRRPLTAIVDVATLTLHSKANLAQACISSSTPVGRMGTGAVVMSGV